MMDDIADRLVQTMKQCKDYSDTVSTNIWVVYIRTYVRKCVYTYCMYCLLIHTYIHMWNICWYHSCCTYVRHVYIGMYVLLVVHHHVMSHTYAPTIPPTLQMIDKELAYNLTVAAERMAEFSRYVYSVHVYACTCVCTHVRMYVHKCICMYVCIYIHKYYMCPSYMNA